MLTPGKSEFMRQKFIAAVVVVMLVLISSASCAGMAVLETEDAGALSVTQAQEILNRVGDSHGTEFGRYRSIHMPELDMRVDGAHVYGFQITFFSNIPDVYYSNAYGWINSVTGLMWFEEVGFCMVAGRNYYGNIVDERFPVPMKDGEIIKYDKFLAPGTIWGSSYWFFDLGVKEIYEEQLRNAGFVGHGQAHSIDSFWLYFDDAGEPILGVTMYVRETEGLWAELPSAESREFFYGADEVLIIIMSHWR